MGVRVVLNLAGIRELKREPGVYDHIEALGERVAERARETAPDPYYAEHIQAEMDEHPISGALCHISAWSKNALAVEAKHGTLTRALDAAGGV